MNVVVIGQGYVGLTIAVEAAKAGHTVLGFDVSEGLVEKLNSGKSHVEGVKSSELALSITTGSYRATANSTELSNPEVVVLAVPTPLNASRKPDLSYIDSACKVIGENLTGPALIINESTSFPGTIRTYIKPAIEKYSKQKFDHQYAISPERVDPGREDFNQKNTPRLYAGLTPEATARTREFYSTFCDNLVEVSSPEVAEAAKLFENTFRQVNIALVNELAQISHALGIDVRETLEAAGTKPYGFMKFAPSAGVGGHCIPVDPSYLADVAQKAGIEATFIKRANEVNLDMPQYIAGRIAKDNGGSLKDMKVLVVGVAYKPNVADTRETPADLLISALKDLGAVVSWNDPVVGTWHGSHSSPLAGADIAVVVTKHDAVPSEDVLNSAPYVFDTTGKIKGAVQL
jgi:UDP-N-acetyl-D-glucosamine dehydrogenase